MAEDVLSQEEVDALLRGVGGDAEEQAPDEDQGGVRPYEIGRQERIVRGRMPTLELVNERFARLFRIGLFNFMRKTAEISVGAVRVLKYSEFIRNLVVPTNLNLVNIRPLRGTALIVFEPALIFQVIDNIFGGSGTVHMRVEGRDFSATEQRIIRRILNVFFQEYQKSWQSIQEFEFEYVRSEMNTQFATIATPTDVVVVSTFSVDLTPGGGDIHVCIPYAMLEPIRDVIYAGVQADRQEGDNRWLTTLSRQIRDTEVGMVANLAHTSITVRELMSLKAGDVIAIDMPDTVHAEVDGVSMVECQYGLNNGRYALKVQRRLGAVETEAGPGE
ncbi:MAG: flagellar motor switch protein FliM [Burkholderiales bacterium]